MKTFDEYKYSRKKILKSANKKDRSVHTPHDYPSKYPKEPTRCCLCGKPLFVITPSTGGKKITRAYYHLKYPGTPLAFSLCYRADLCYTSYKFRKVGE